MDDIRTRRRQERVSRWTAVNLLDYGQIRPHVPLSEVAITPMAPGRFAASVTIAGSDRVTLLWTRHDAVSVGVNVLKPEYFGFAIAVPSPDGCLVNGTSSSEWRVHMPGSSNEFYVRGGRRNVVGVAVCRAPFIEMIAALRGVGPEEIVLNESCLELPPGVAQHLHARVVRLLEDAASYSRCALDNDILGLFADAYLYGHPDRSSTPGVQARNAGRIVRRSEERFASAQGAAISLADLCAAAGVGKTALYKAFHTMCGEPPLAYFRRRQLTQARSLLLRSPLERGAVKRAALEVGMTELGRFATEYRQLFGELPSATLSADAGQASLAP